MWGRRRTAALGTAALLLACAIPTSGRPGSDVVTAASTTAPRAYVVTNAGRLQVLDTTDGTVVGGANTGARGTDVAVDRDRGRVYVVNGWSGGITAVDPEAGRVVGRIDAGAPLAHAVLRPDGRRLYVSGSGNVAVIDPATFRMVAAVEVGGQPLGLATSPDGHHLYVANAQDGTLRVLDTAAASQEASVEVGGLPQRVAVSPDGTAVYVSSLHLPDRTGTVSLVDPRTARVVWSTAVGEGAGSVAVTPDGRHVYVALDRSVAVVDTATRATRSLPFAARAVAVPPGDRRVFLATGETTTVLDGADDEVLATFQLGGLDDDGRGSEAAAIAFEAP
ncbi:cytochrome D1 domain-containing protein [Saccharothrix syringae]|uniref:YncE family protein n=1 Tax=Saccharothrix syringae TaxID=103733 RepID=A0A5Q0HCJ0_SACSY|nr:YncE family protein [Saccharothrix syringae]QFZ23901.1 YncE family protein [Saccharothrix syringae]